MKKMFGNGSWVHQLKTSAPKYILSSWIVLFHTCCHNICIQVILSHPSLWAVVSLLSLSPVLSSYWLHFFFFFFFLFRVVPAAYGGSQARGWIRYSCQLTPQLGSFTRWARSGSNLYPHGDHVMFLTHWATVRTPHNDSISRGLLPLEVLDNVPSYSAWEPPLPIALGQPANSKPPLLGMLSSCTPAWGSWKSVSSVTVFENHWIHPVLFLLLCLWHPKVPESCSSYLRNSSCLPLPLHSPSSTSGPDFLTLFQSILQSASVIFMLFDLIILSWLKSIHG